KENLQPVFLRDPGAKLKELLVAPRELPLQPRVLVARGECFRGPVGESPDRPRHRGHELADRGGRRQDPRLEKRSVALGRSGRLRGKPQDAERQHADQQQPASPRTLLEDLGGGSAHVPENGNRKTENDAITGNSPWPFDSFSRFTFPVSRP